MSEPAMELIHAEEAAEGWKCENDQDAEWCLLQIKRANSEKDFWKAHYKAAQDSVNMSCDETIGRMEHFLKEYFDRIPHKKTKTEENYALPSGKLMMKAQNTTYERDDDEVIQWLKDNKKPEFIKTKEALDWESLKETLTVIGETVADADGQIIPCIKAVDHDPAFKVQIKK